MTRTLLEDSADWRERHGSGDNVRGTLAWASRNTPLPDRDWASCATALLAYGMPAAEPEPDAPGIVRIDGRRLQFSDSVTDVLVTGHP